MFHVCGRQFHDILPVPARGHIHAHPSARRRRGPPCRQRAGSRARRTGHSGLDPLLRRRLAGEQAQMDRVRGTLARRVFVVPWQAEPPVGVAALAHLAG